MGTDTVPTEDGTWVLTQSLQRTGHGYCHSTYRGRDMGTDMGLIDTCPSFVAFCPRGAGAATGRCVLMHVLGYTMEASGGALDTAPVYTTQPQSLPPGWVASRFHGQSPGSLQYGACSLWERGTHSNRKHKLMQLHFTCTCARQGPTFGRRPQRCHSAADRTE